MTPSVYHPGSSLNDSTGLVHKARSGRDFEGERSQDAMDVTGAVVGQELKSQETMPLSPVFLGTSVFYRCNKRFQNSLPSETKDMSQSSVIPSEKDPCKAT